MNAAESVTSINEISNMRMIHSVPLIGGAYGSKDQGEGIIS